jgi:CRP-like cAMP-binding protein
MGALIAGNPVFSAFVGRQLEGLIGIIRETRQVEEGAYLIHEGDPAKEVYILRSGRLEVVKQDESGQRLHRLAVLEPGMSIGEVALLDAGPRSASVRALCDSRVLVIPIRDLQSEVQPHQPIDLQLKLALGHELARRARSSNQLTVRSLQEKLQEAEMRAEMGRFMARVLIVTCLYTLALSTMQGLVRYVPDTTMVSVPIVIAFALSLLINIRTSIFPISAYGFTTKSWQPAVREAVLFSLPIAAIVVVAKVILVHHLPAMEGQPVFDFYRSKGVGPGTALLAAGAYALFAPVQEMIARSGMQSSLMLFLRGRHKTIMSIVLATLLFSATHLVISELIALLVFPIGLFWGWLYARNPTLIGVCLSHVGLGLFGLFVVGFPTR